MIRHENDCVGCPPEMGCLGSSCPNWRVAHFYCDECGYECSPDEMVEYNNCIFCLDCAAKLNLEEDELCEVSEDYDSYDYDDYGEDPDILHDEWMEREDDDDFYEIL